MKDGYDFDKPYDEAKSRIAKPRALAAAKDVRELVKVKPLEWLTNENGTTRSVYVKETHVTYFVLRGLRDDHWLLHVNAGSAASFVSAEAAIAKAVEDHESRIYSLLEAR